MIAIGFLILALVLPAVALWGDVMPKRLAALCALALVQGYALLVGGLFTLLWRYA